jgi:hypothetical protein
MVNNIRTPRPGTTVASRRIAAAVDDEGWQKFRLSMKGKSTATKLDMLKKYWTDNGGTRTTHNDDSWKINVRVDNYIKALCRGGQLTPGQSLETVLTALDADWKSVIKK